MLSVAQVCANWRIQAHIIAATLDAQGESAASQQLYSVLRELDRVWCTQFGAEYSDELVEFFRDTAAEGAPEPSNVIQLKLGGNE